jgi:hypothetical protein
VVAGPALEAGDANEDLEFNFDDIFQVLARGKYETGQPATWGEGDWDGAPGGSPGSPPTGSGQFDFDDIFASLVTGNYETGPYATGAATSAVPEPSTMMLVLVSLVTLAAMGRKEEDGRRKTEDRRPKTEDGRRKTFEFWPQAVFTVAWASRSRTVFPSLLSLSSLMSPGSAFARLA